ncbi:carboxypeptidase regulatory-like domain-containing protein [Mumia sp. ZJ1417]|uniref:carboxypeptidase regulatory-like domain-containing protein n=1 Tax=Mumia sp. ZJ1417 TaxID=2708082 RepID=UPI00141FC1E1|nr:carboxypeptidase regulatory-like domain-containing protein [Mumia sp. ZJ1417]QMW65522.1 carboxypeptidase regulatory-like domain-containing protein [Mumia sp. ZJ1417]
MLSSSPARWRLRALVVALVAALGLSMLVAAPAQAAAGTVSGKVLAQSPGGTASGAVGVGVGLYPATGGGGAVASTATGAGGSYTIPGVPDGRYTVRTWSPPTGYAAEYYGNAWSVYDATVIEVKNGAALVLGDIVLEKAGFIRGTVKDEFGMPVAGASVSFRESEMSGGYGVTTDASGAYESQSGDDSKDLVPGDYWVSVSVYDDSNNGWPYYYVDQRVVVSPGTTTTFDVRLQERPTVDFTVLGPDGKPLVDAPLLIHVFSNGAWGPIQSGPHMTDDEGRYRFTDGAEAYKVYFGVPAGYTGAAVGQWWKDAASVAGATPITFPTRQTHLSHTVQLAAPSTPPTPIAAATPRITGSARTGQVLRAIPGAWAPAGVSLRYQWRADGMAIAGATAPTFRVSNAHAGKRFTVTVTGSKSGLASVARTSAPTARAIGTLTATTPKISGKAKKGKKLTIKAGAWGPGRVRLSYQWFRNGKKITKARKASYTLTKRDVGKRLTVKVTGTRTSYATVVKTSKKTAKVRK